MEEFRKRFSVKKMPLIIFGIFGIFLIVQHRFVGMYFDDYGYASISYGHDMGTVGTNFTLKNLIEYLQWHYMNWGGRILSFFIEILSFKIGVWFIQLLQALVIWGISFFSYMIIRTDDAKKNWKLAILIVITYCATSVFTFNRGIFWYTASVLYVWPFLPLLAVVFLQRNGKENMKKSKVILSGILLFVAGFSQEQVAVLVFIYAIISFIYDVKKTKIIQKRNIYITFMAILGSMIEILAPGNFARSSGEQYNYFGNLSFLQKVAHNLPMILNIHIGRDNKVECIMLIISSIAISVYFFSKKKILRWRGNLVATILLSVALIILWKDASIDSSILEIGLNKTTLCATVEVLWMILYCVNVLRFLWNIKRKDLFALVIAAIFSQGMMLIIPTIPTRCQIPFEIVMHIIVSISIIESLSGVWKRICYVIIPAAGVLAVCNISVITYGYYKNLDVANINHYKLIEKSSRIKAGMNIDTIVLYRMLDDNYAADMPYQQEFCETWIKTYYELPQSISFVWENLNQKSKIREVVQSDKPEIASLYPKKIDDSVERNPDGSVNISVVPKVMSNNLKIFVNGQECDTVTDKGFVSTRIVNENLNDDLKIYILNIDTNQRSKQAILKVE